MNVPREDISNKHRGLAHNKEAIPEFPHYKYVQHRDDRIEFWPLHKHTHTETLRLKSTIVFIIYGSGSVWCVRGDSGKWSK